MATERFYFHLLDGRRVGPLELAILQRMADKGEIGPNARLKRDSDGRRFRASQKLRFDVQDEKKEEKRLATASDKSDGRRTLSKNVGAAPFGDAEVAPADVFNPFWELTRSSGVVDKSVAVLGTRVNKRPDKMFYVYDVLGRRRGPYSVVDLKRLAVEGQIEQNTTLETLLGKRGRAVEIRELALFFSNERDGRRGKARRLANFSPYFPERFWSDPRDRRNCLGVDSSRAFWAFVGIRRAFDSGVVGGVAYWESGVGAYWRRF